MTALVALTRPRRLPRWVWLAAAVFAAQVVLIWRLSAPATPQPPPPAPWQTRFLDADETAAQEWLAALSPTVFLLPGVHDFSGPAWLRPQAAGYPEESLAAAPRPLPAAQAWAVAAPPTFPVSVATGLAAGGLPPPAPSRRPAPPLPLAGPRWRLISAPPGVELPAADTPTAPGPGPLPRVRLRVVHDAAGFPATPPVLLESSGDPEADAAALAAARRLRFKLAVPAGRPGDPAGVAEVELDWGPGGAAP